MPWTAHVSASDDRDDGIFNIMVRSDGQEWTVQKQYRQFLDLDRQMAHCSSTGTPDGSLSRAALPKDEGTFGFRRKMMPRSSAQKRQRFLETYFSHLASQIDVLADNPTLHGFLNEALPSGWEAAWSEETRKHYYYNRTTGESTWTEPECEAGSRISNLSASRSGGPQPPLPSSSPTSSRAGTSLVKVGDSPAKAGSSRVVGPKLYVIVNPCRGNPNYEKDETRHEVRQHLLRGMNDGFRYGLDVKSIDFPKESPLHNHMVFSVGATFETLMNLAERQQYKKAASQALPTGASWNGRNLGSDYDKSSKDMDKLANREHLVKWQKFRCAEMDSFIGSEDPDTFFTPFEVLQLLCVAVETAKCSESKKGSPLHGHPLMLLGKAAGEVDCILALPDRKDLEKKSIVWHGSCSRSRVPVQDLAAYLGDGSAMYFDFMHKYAQWLVGPTIFCIAAVIFYEIYCATCGCKKTFATSWFSYSVTLMVSVWSTLFCARCQHNVKEVLHQLGHDTLVRRKNSCDIDSADVFFSFAGLRVTPRGAATTGKPNSGDALLPYAFMVLCMGVLLLITALIIGVLLWVGDLVALYTDNIILVNLPILLYIVVIGVVEQFYRWLAQKLTQLERHVMYAEYLKSLTYKSAAFNIMNTLGWFFYVAFWQRDMVYLRSQLLIFFTVKQVLGNITETGVPWLQNWWHTRDRTRGKSKLIVSAAAKEQSAIEDEWEREASYLGDDFTEIGILFAAAIWFAPVFPMGMPLALLHAVTETSSDRYKMTNVARRPLPDRYYAVMYEAWLLILSAIGCIGVVVSMALTYIAHEGAWSVSELLVAEHVILFVKLYLLLSIPSEPEWLTHHMSH